MANRKMLVHNYPYARRILDAIENEYVNSGSSVHFPDAGRIREDLQEWFDSSYIHDPDVEIEVFQTRITVQLIARHLKQLKSDFDALCASPDAFDLNDVGRYLQRVHNWVGSTSDLLTKKNRDVTDTWISQEVESFFLATRDILGDVYWDAQGLKDFLDRTSKSELSKGVGALLADGLAHEYRRHMHTQRAGAPGSEFEAAILRDVHPQVLNASCMGDTFVFAVESIRRQSGMGSFATLEWFRDNDLTGLVTSACDQSETFTRAIRECANYPENVNGARVRAAIELLSLKYAVSTIANDAFFSFGNRIEASRALLKVCDAIESCVIDKAAIARVFEKELAGNVHVFDPPNTALSRMVLDWENHQQQCDISGTRNGRPITEVLGTLFDELPCASDREIVMRIVSDLYSPYGRDVDHARHDRIVAGALAEMRFDVNSFSPFMGPLDAKLDDPTRHL